ncbi:hypothetical protein [Rhizobium sp. SSA_523]|uniref:hypothetical protein n=1 Tax=Rhizobium sp. SSA_523 TaxID=2952477 RepID=UPI00209194F4|nr:hypothetical protein [Rhizobium sp. SSA_523]MCO5734012.1 hypothetical protein [Rhizobium sp. SSA_523]WKC24654.1 hypothetical protein QTJ18_11490 [Rhizobium sp. SSA_523]
MRSIRFPKGITLSDDASIDDADADGADVNDIDENDIDSSNARPARRLKFQQRVPDIERMAGRYCPIRADALRLAQETLRQTVAALAGEKRLLSPLQLERLIFRIMHGIAHSSLFAGSVEAAVDDTPHPEERRHRDL